MSEGDPKHRPVHNSQEGGSGHWTSEYYDTPEGTRKRPVWNQDTPRTSGPEAGRPVGENSGSGEPNAQRLDNPMGEYEYDERGYLVRR